MSDSRRIAERIAHAAAFAHEGRRPPYAIPAGVGRAGRGFTLVEVMVALIVIAIGMLGIAKMEALALSSTGVARTQSLAAIEAASLASAMHANRSYWAGEVTTPVSSFTVSGGTVTDTTMTLSQEASCTAPYCSPTLLAAWDVQQWAGDLNGILPNATATVTCVTTDSPIDCSIQIKWVEQAVSVNQQEAADTGTTSAFETPSYTLYVVP